MKKVLLALLLAGGTALFTSCDPDDDDIIPEPIEDMPNVGNTVETASGVDFEQNVR